MKLIFLTLFLMSSCTTLPSKDKKVFLLTSEKNENAQGAEAYKEILSKEQKSQNQTHAKMIENIGRELAKFANKPDFNWEFTTLESKEPNAFCLPGGKVAIYTGIIPYAKNEAGLAAIMGHEIAHALLRHGGQRMSQQMATNVALTGLAVLGLSKMDPTKKTLAMAALGAGATYGVILPFSRSHETEADEVGMILMAKAGYDPNEAVEFWDRFSKATSKSPPEFLSTHPNSANRREHLRKLLPKALEIYNQSSKKGLGKNF